ncbi:MOSC domain-containing protein [Rhodococcus sp. X156]|uniref:MOSC domain-containing protein n=1 Tax=Rhodococcus sp. X156 TaxID=2499145 RepID=UPI0019D097F3|nr:MOSC domain-containing protein [Rhodococcus sp. X156]
MSRAAKHAFSKTNQDAIRLLAGLGVDGDAHAGATVQHRWAASRTPTAPNLRQVHLLQAELHDELRAEGFEVAPGALGENVTTRGVDLLALPTGTRLSLGAESVVELTGLRNPCVLIDRFQPGLRRAVSDRDHRGRIVRRKAGVMAVVLVGGQVQPGDPVVVELPAPPHRPLRLV